MENPIEERKRMVQSRIEKSFNEGLNVPEMEELEKAHQDGDLHPNGKWVWVSSANGGKGDWRTIKGRAHQKHLVNNSQPKKDGEQENDNKGGNNSNDNSGGDKKTDKKKPDVDVEKNLAKLSKKIDSLAKKKEGMWLKVRNLSNIFSEDDFGSKYLYGAKMYKPKGVTASDDYYKPIGYQKKLKNGNTLSIFRANHGEFFIKESGGVDKYVDRLIIRDKDAVKDLKDLIKKFNETE